MENDISLSNEKFFLMMNEGIVLRHHVLAQGVQVGATKTIVIENFLITTNREM